MSETPCVCVCELRTMQLTADTHRKPRAKSPKKDGTLQNQPKTTNRRLRHWESGMR
jgi:hypothetical protein